MKLDDIKNLNIPDTPGCYQYLDKTGVIIYVGKAANLKSRVFSYWQKSAQLSAVKTAMLEEIKEVRWIEVGSEIEAFLLEANLIKKFQPKYNIIMRDDKRYAYIKISTEDEIPGVFITRKIDKSGKYFGPFTSGLAVKETVKAIRKIWPYCTERKVKAKPCFYYQVKKCTGVCGGLFDLQDYRQKIIKPIIKFLQGDAKKLLKDLEIKISNLEFRITNEFSNDEFPSIPQDNNRNSKLKIDSEFPFGSEPLRVEDKIQNLELGQELSKLKSQLYNFKNVLEHTQLLSVHDKYASDVVELAKLLNLPKVPVRIEGYDISNIYGKSAVGSMVVFAEGEPDKNEYRKFKIKVSEKDGDVGMLREVLERRFKHSISNIQYPISGEIPKDTGYKISDISWASPDLIIIDGGKGQLNVATKILKKAKLDIPVIAISKGLGLRSAAAPDKLFFPGEKKPLELPLASPVLHLIKRVRDEAHRFAIKYHKELRSKRFYQ